jgi:hypothetical protein
MGRLLRLFAFRPAHELWNPVVSGVGWKERWPNNAIWTEEAIDYWIDSTKV